MISKHITLHTIDEIFNNEASHKPSVYAIMLYINCLTHHFKKKEPYITNLSEFTLAKVSIPNHTSYVSLFAELEKASLIKIQDESYLFFNVWTKHMDISSMNNDLFISKSFTCMDFKDQIYKSDQLIELCAMKYKISKAQVIKLMQSFFDEQSAIDTKYPNEQECKKHFLYWIAYNKDKLASETVKSNSKILGR
jgi:hypothetical protein